MLPAWAHTGSTAGSTATDEAACQAAVADAARKTAVPHRVLGTIALVESGRPIGNRIVPWPWSINVGGVGRTFVSKQDAIAAVRELRAAGTRSIDVGCMQINLAAHPEAFETLDSAFDPASNADYAARFLHVLSQQTGHIASAMTAYHSHTPQFAAEYARRLLTVWPGAATLGLTAEPDPPLPPQQPPQPRPRSAASHLQNISQHGTAWPIPRTEPKNTKSDTNVIHLRMRVD